MRRLFLILFFNCIIFSLVGQNYFLPVQVPDRHSVHYIRLTKIGKFGLLRKARPAVPAHYHTGIDLMRPSGNYENEPIFPFTKGIVISKRSDGPYAQLILEHDTGAEKIWSVYEHIAGIKVELGDWVDSQTPIARFMNRDDLNRYGWQFDHFHFEILKIEPIKLKATKSKPYRFFGSYSLKCYKYEDLEKYFFNPVKFFEQYL